MKILLKNIVIFSFIGIILYLWHRKSFPFINLPLPHYIVFFFIIILLSIISDVIDFTKHRKYKSYKDKNKFLIVLRELLFSAIIYISLSFLWRLLIRDSSLNTSSVISGLIGILIGRTIVILRRYKKDNNDNEDEVFEDGW